MNLKYEKREKSPDISFSASLVRWKTVTGTLTAAVYSIKLELFSSATKG